MSWPWFTRFLPAALRVRQTLKAHHAGRLAGRFTPMPTDAPRAPDRTPLHIHFWTPYSWSSTAIHVERVLPQLREQAAALGLPWQITFGPQLPETPVDWLLCLKTVPPAGLCPLQRTVLLLNDDAHRVWGRLEQFGHVVAVSSPVLASLLGIVHSRVWFVEETESTDFIEKGGNALDQMPPSKRAPVLLWHGERYSLDGLRRLRPVLETFGEETGAELVVVTNQPSATKQWASLRVRYVTWSPDVLVASAAQARLGIVPARPTLADSYLKSAGRLRCLFALGCPALGDARSPDVVDFSNACNLPSANTPDEWLAALRQLWNDPDRLDQTAQRGHDLVRERYSTTRTAAQWIWFLSGGAEGRR